MKEEEKRASSHIPPKKLITPRREKGGAVRSLAKRIFLLPSSMSQALGARADSHRGKGKRSSLSSRVEAKEKENHLTGVRRSSPKERDDGNFPATEGGETGLYRLYEKKKEEDGRESATHAFDVTREKEKDRGEKSSCRQEKKVTFLKERRELRRQEE